MNYKKGYLYRYVVLGIVLFIAWYWMEYPFIVYRDTQDILPLLMGTHGGYGYYLIIASVLMTINIFFVDMDIDLFDLKNICRHTREDYLKNQFKRTVVCTFMNTLCYVTIQFVCSIFFSGVDSIKIHKLYIVFPLYFISVYLVMLFGATLFLLIYAINKNRYFSAVIVVAYNIFIAFYGKSGWMYGNLTIEDKIVTGESVSYISWTVYLLINILSVMLVYTILEEIYRRKDIL